MADHEWQGFDEAGRVAYRVLGGEESATVILQVATVAGARTGLVEAIERETRQGRVLPLMLVCAQCGRATAGIDANRALATNIADSDTGDAIRVGESGWLSRFSSTMGASGDITLPSMPVACGHCSTTVDVDGASLHRLMSDLSASQTTVVALRRG